jgi:hypothetical protein
LPAALRVLKILSAGADRSVTLELPTLNAPLSPLTSNTDTNTFVKHGKRLNGNAAFPDFFTPCSQTQPRRVAGVDDAATLRLRERRALP